MTIIFINTAHVCASEFPLFFSDVTPFSFTVNARLQSLTDNIHIYLEEQTTNDISHQFIFNQYPLYGHSADSQTEWDIIKEKEMLRNEIQAMGITQIKVSDCYPSTTYYIMFPSHPNVYSVTTSDVNAFLYHSPQLIVEFPQSNASYHSRGMLITATHPGATYPVSAIVGDGVNDNEAILNLSNFFDSNGMNIDPAHDMDINVSAHGKSLTPINRSLTIENTENFEVAHIQSLFMNEPPECQAMSLQQFSESNAYMFTIQANDLETEIGNLSISGHSSNWDLVPDHNILVSFNGTDYSVSVTPVNYQSGSASITMTVSDGYSYITSIVQLDVVPVANMPIIIAESTVYGVEDTPLQLPINIQLSDTDGSEQLENICVSGIPEGALLTPSVFNGSCWEIDNDMISSLYYIPKADDHSDFELNLNCQSREIANDDTAQSTKTIFIQIEAINDPPSISHISDITMNENTMSSPIALTISDIDTASHELHVDVHSDIPNLFPSTSFMLTGTGNTRYLVLQPAIYKSGQSRITLTVSDGQLTDETYFNVTVLQFIPELLCDFDGNAKLELNDLIITLQALTQIKPSICYATAALNSETIRINDAIYIIFKLADIVFHSGDYNPKNLQISMNEMLRVIQLHNSEAYHCDNTSEDGYAPGESDTLHACPFHSADYAHDGLMPDWTIDKNELNRFIELYNADFYVPDLNSEDGFSPVHMP
jgi:hypothetical protein